MNLTPFLLFDGNCAEAMEFYRSCFAGDLTIIRVGAMASDPKPSEDQAQKVAYARLKSGAIEISATDWQHRTRRPLVGNTVALYITADSNVELRRIFDKLSVGAPAELLDDLVEQSFGTYGHLADKYGVHWFFRGEVPRADE